MNASKSLRALSLILVLSIMLLPVPSAQAAEGDTTRVSVASDGTQADGQSYEPSLSADGRYVAFGSAATQLVSGDTNGTDDVFVHDRQTGETSRVSVASDGTQGNDPSVSTSISADGRYVAFDSLASNLVTGDTNGMFDIFVHDLVTGETARVSVASDGTQGDRSSGAPSISADGRYVAFRSYARNLVSGDTNYQQDVFVHDRQTGTTTRVSVASDGTQAYDWSGFPSISADGRYVAFGSAATQLVSGDTNGMFDVFVHDLVTGETSRVSVASDGTQGNDPSVSTSISADGRYVAFDSLASNLVSGDTNVAGDVFVHDRQTGETSRVSVATGGIQGNDGSEGPSISADGRFVAFDSVATNLVSGDTNGWKDVFVHDRQTGETRRASVATGGAQGDGDSTFWPSISADGRYVAFGSWATNLVSGDTNGAWDVFVHENAVPVSLLTLRSAAALDGWILESAESSNRGGTMNAAAATFNLGDDAADRQYRAVLSFNTSGLPDAAVITKATLKIKRQGLPVGTNPFTTHLGLKVDIRKPFFGSTAGLAISDFQAPASLNNAATFNKTPAAGAWYSAVLSSTAYPYINRTGTTQFRLRFAKDDNDDMSADYVRFYSGNVLTASYRPVLELEYYVP